MYDYLKIEKQIDAQSFFDTGNLEICEVFANGFQKYLLDYRKPIEIWYNATTNIIRVQGSIPYFWQGHNFSQSKKGFEAAITYISTMINISLWDAKVVKFEYGKTIQVDQTAEIILDNHLSIGRKKPGQNGECKFFEDKGDSIKLYDAVHNYKHKVPVVIRENQMKDAGLIKGEHYVRFEKRYVNALRFFGYDITVKKLISRDINNCCRRDLYRSYKKVKINPGIRIPDTKKELNSTTIAVIALMQIIAQSGFDTDAKRMIWSTIKLIPCLNINDKKARKRELVKALKTCSINNHQFDLSTTLIRKLSSDRF